MKLSSRTTLLAACLFAAALAIPPTDFARQGERERTATKPASTASPKQQRNASKKSASASRVFEQIMGAPDRSIPKDLLDKAEAVAVFPGMIKAGLGVGGRGGSGIISRRATGGWSAPALFKMGGPSVGLHIGA